MAFKPVNNKKNYQYIIEQFVKQIADGTINKGDKIPPERSLSETLNVSRSSLREALSVMEILGIINVRSGEGTFVSEFNPMPFIDLIIPVLLKNEEIEEDIIDLRILLEVACARKAAENIKNHPDKPDYLRRIIAATENTLDYTESTQLDIELHKIIYELSGNIIFQTLGNFVSIALSRSVKFNRSKLLQIPENEIILKTQHKLLLEAILENNCNRAAEIMELHLNYTKEEIKRIT